MKKSELLEMIKKLEERVARLEAAQRRPAPVQLPTFPSIPTIKLDLCSDGSDHSYPRFWGGIIPPPCEKCGERASWPTVTCKIPPYPHYE